MNNYFPTEYQHFIYLSRYSRWLPEKNRRETWNETVDRYFTFFDEHLKENNNFELDKKTKEELREAILSLEVMPSMRCLMTAGEALKRDNIAGFNCSYTAIDSPRAFDEILYILMCGTGVGYSVEQKYVEQLPIVAEDFSHSDTTIIVADSKLGWAKALKELVHLLYGGQIPKWDISKLRPAGAPLKTFGGRSSGPAPLVDLFRFCVNVFMKAAGRRLTTLECHDIVCKIAEIVVVGGVRRSALISLSDISDDRLRTAKSGEWWKNDVQRALANNSFVIKDKMDVGVFMREWLSLYESKSGERGLFSRSAATEKIEKGGRRDSNFEFGTNPCVTYDTKLLTDKGYKKIGDLVGKEVTVWNGKEWSIVTPFSTGTNPLVRVILSDGTSIDCTPYHKFILKGDIRVEARNLKSKDKLEKFQMPILSTTENSDPEIDAYSQGFYFGKEKLLSKTTIPHLASVEYKIKWLCGLFDADGCITKNNSLQLVSNNLNFLKDLRLMMTTVGVQAKVCDIKRKGQKKCKEEYQISIDSLNVKTLMDNGAQFFRLKVANVNPNRDARRFVEVVSVENLHRQEETFCATDSKNNTLTFDGVVTGNCGEILLRSKQFCNLSEVVVRATDDISSLSRKIRLATILGTMQSTLTNFKYISKKWKENTEEERLLGVSLTGIMDNPLTSGENSELFKFELEKNLTDLKQIAIDTNKEWAEKIGISPSTAITCAKPSGCTTLDTKIRTKEGIMTMAEIFSEYSENVNIFECIPGTWLPLTKKLEVFDENNDLQNVTKLFVNGLSEIFEIEDENGIKYKFTGNHKLKTKSGWKRVDELTERDEILSF